MTSRNKNFSTANTITNHCIWYWANLVYFQYLSIRFIIILMQEPSAGKIRVVLVPYSKRHNETDCRLV